MRIPKALSSLYVQVLIAIALGVLVGFVWPDTGAAMKPLGDGFIKLVKMIIAPIIFTTVVVGIAQMGAMKDVGRIGLRALVYFEVVSTLALVIGLVIVRTVEPGSGIGFDASLFFIIAVLGSIAAATGFSLFRFIRYIAEEILIVLGTSSSESALPRLMKKLEAIGCPKAAVGLVVPAGYSFNLDGTSIYMTMAAIFVAQASGVDLTVRQELGLLAVLLLTSKGAAAVTGSGFVTLAATLAVFPSIPVAGLTLLLGVDRFMSEARAITNLIGNAVATMVVARWEGGLDMARVRHVLRTGRAIDEDADWRS